MDNLHTETRQIAARLRGARMTADKSAAELAACTGMSEEAYLKMEEGAEDYSFTFLYKCAKALDLDISALVSGDDPKLSFYTLTRAGEGMPIKRRAGFNYRHLASKLKHMPEDAREKLRETLQRIINEGSGGLICIIL